MAVIAVSEAVSCFLGYRLLKCDKSILEKTALVVVLLVPIFGPIFYLFLVEEVPPQNPFLRNHGPRGSYTDRMISMRADKEAADKRRSEMAADGEASGLPGDGKQG
jgi:hypothetical protein